MPTPVNILQVFSYMGRGGAEMRTLEVLRQIDRRRYAVQFATLAGRCGSLDPEIRQLGSPIHAFRLKRLDFARRFRRLLRRQHFDVVQANLHYASGHILRLAAQCGVPARIAHFHNSGDGRGSGPLRKAYRKLMRGWLDRYATGVLCCSRGAMAGAWRPHWESDPRCRVLYYGLAPADFDGKPEQDGVRREFAVPPDAPLCIHVGRMVHQKNHVRLISIFSRVLDRRPQSRLLLVGRGDQDCETQVRHRIRQLGIGDRVVFCGERSDVPRLLKAADVMIFPSLWEGLPGVVLEACAVGTPIVATDLPGIEEIAGRLPGVATRSLDAGDRAWAGAVDRALLHRPTDQTRQAARQALAQSEFTVSRYAREMCRVWDEQAGSPASTRQKAA